MQIYLDIIITRYICYCCGISCFSSTIFELTNSNLLLNITEDDTQSSSTFIYSMIADGFNLTSDIIPGREPLGSMPDRPYAIGMAYAR